MNMRIGIILLAVILLFCGQAMAEPQANHTNASATPLIPGTYLLCYGDINECIKSGTGNYLDFEETGIGRATFKYEESGFMWRQEGNMLYINAYEDENRTLEIGNNSQTLTEPGGGEPYVLIEADRAVFKPGVYILCDKTAPDKCEKLARDFLDSASDLPETDQNSTFILVSQEAGANVAEGEIWAEDKKNFPLTWTKNTTHVVLNIPNATVKKKILAISQDRLIDSATKDIYFRMANERVLRSAN